MAERGGSKDREYLVKYVGEMATELATMAKSADCVLLSYLLHMTVIEAGRIIGAPLMPLRGNADIDQDFLH